MKTKRVLILGAVSLSIILPIKGVFANATQSGGGWSSGTLALTETTCGVSSCHNNALNTGKVADAANKIFIQNQA